MEQNCKREIYALSLNICKTLAGMSVCLSVFVPLLLSWAKTSQRLREVAEVQGPGSWLKPVLKFKGVPPLKHWYGSSEPNCSGLCLQDGDPENHYSSDLAPVGPGKGTPQAGLAEGTSCGSLGCRLWNQPTSVWIQVWLFVTFDLWDFSLCPQFLY